MLSNRLDIISRPFMGNFLATVTAEISAVLPLMLLQVSVPMKELSLALWIFKEISIIAGFNSYNQFLFTIAWGLVAIIITVMPFYKTKIVALIIMIKINFSTLS